MFRRANDGGLTDHELFDEILDQIESQALTHSPKLPSTLLIDQNIDTEYADSSNVSISSNSRNTASTTSVLGSPSISNLESCRLIIPHISSISYDEQEAFSGTLETSPCGTIATAGHYECDNGGAGEPFDPENAELCRKCPPCPQGDYDSESHADADILFEYFCFPRES
ncbi:hypothetical protein GQX73_g344 [Xylaria multiplex]|uniref:Uncharacterized protein n=1 Tax=Xylaria multiplex TaxID=323545 RepID=A0A7C8IYB0_9PEZI|nr:hypothetical protein GQX73_g344 [Xylaria multiplex]